MCGSKMQLVKGKYSIIRECVKADMNNREFGESRCTNYLSIRDCNYIYSEIKILAESEMLKEGYVGNIFHLRYSVEIVREHYIRVSVINSRTQK